ncbi:DUF502 domain-containing protein [Flavihumibacter sp. R14]|nr:DUF502 domain-containing protein [Flavihumibacter soli]
MKRLSALIRALIIRGMIILLPLIALIVLLEKTIGFLGKLLLPITSRISLGYDGPLIRLAFSLVVLLLICLIAGLFARTKPCQNLISYIETQILLLIPGYSFVKSMSANLAGVEDIDLQRVVLVRYDDSSQIGFLIEEIGDKAVVYLPDAPHPLSGSVIIFQKERVSDLPITSKQALSLFTQMGKGTSRYLNADIKKVSPSAAKPPPM